MRLRVPDDGATVIRRPRARRGRASTRALDDPVIARADGIGALQLRRRGRRPRRRDHARGARRGPRHEHRQAAAGDRGRVGCGAAAASTPTCRCCTGPTARSSQSATAPPPSRSSATPATSRRRSATTSRCSAGAPATTRRSSRPRSSSRASRSTRVQPQPGARFDEVKLRWLNGTLHPGPEPRRSHRAPGSLHGRDGLEQLVRISQEKIHTLADFMAALRGPARRARR